MAARFQRVGAFIDWQSQLLGTPSVLADQPTERCRHALRAVGKKIAQILCARDKDSVYQVQMRLYHGWTTGITQTDNRRAFRQIEEMLSPDDIFPSVRVVSLADIEFGDRLLEALPERENKGLRIHLPNTRRRRPNDAGYEEKMVDTALSVDLLAWARSEPTGIALVFSSDDDLIPPVFVAEAWMKPSGGVVKLVRSSLRGDSKFLELRGIIDD